MSIEIKKCCYICDHMGKEDGIETCLMDLTTVDPIDDKCDDFKLKDDLETEY